MKRNLVQDVDTHLRHEARLLRQKDGFSPLLHQRIMTKLRQEGLAATPVTPELGLSWWRIAMPLAVAAALALAAWIVLRPTPAEPAPNPIANDPHGTLNLPQITVSPQRLDATTSALEERKYAYLDRDAKKLLAFVADQLPSLPETK